MEEERIGHSYKTSVLSFYMNLKLKKIENLWNKEIKKFKKKKLKKTRLLTSFDVLWRFWHNLSDSAVFSMQFKKIKRNTFFLIIQNGFILSFGKF